MATEVYTTEIMVLQDETEVEVRPLPISKMRKFMRMWSEHINEVSRRLDENSDKEDADRDFNEADLTDAQYDTFIKMCALALEGQLKEDKTEKKFLEYLEDNLDEPTIYKILKVSGGLDLKGEPNPNQMNPALGAGTN